MRVVVVQNRTVRCYLALITLSDVMIVETSSENTIDVYGTRQPRKWYVRVGVLQSIGGNRSRRTNKAGSRLHPTKQRCTERRSKDRKNNFIVRKCPVPENPIRQNPAASSPFRMSEVSASIFCSSLLRCQYHASITPTDVGIDGLSSESPPATFTNGRPAGGFVPTPPVANIVSTCASTAAFSTPRLIPCA